ncbi:AAA family ATPase [Parasphingorhabdus sp.]|uniref:chloramphenicol phosphotransferase CPT family protein n=1 Tax=Parasphingorhabdus sp. TaxID=2709688 RepID=UPI0032ECEAF5
MQTRIVILNGASSVGKTSTAKAIQEFASRPYMHLQMDSFLEMQPRRLDNHTDGLLFQNIGSEREPEIAVSSGPALQKLMAGMRGAVVAMVEHGNNLIVDDVFWDQKDLDEYRALLVEYDPKFVLLDAPLDIIESRERSRGDRVHGLARWQADRVRQIRDYDLLIDTSKSDAVYCAKQIVGAFDL